MVPYTHPDETMCSNAKPFKRYIGPPNCSEEGKVGGHELGAPPTRRKETEAVRWVDVAWSKRQNARTSSAIGQHIIPNQEAGCLLPLAMLERGCGDQGCGHAGPEATSQARGAPTKDLLH